MSMMSPEAFFLVGVGFACAALLYLPLLLIMHALMPREVTDRYWRMPHFGPFELGLGSPPCGFLRTQMFIAAMVFPSIAKKRGIDRSWPVPNWYRIAARALIAWGVAATFGFVGILSGLSIYAAVNGEFPPPTEWKWRAKDKAMLAVLIGYGLFLLVQLWRLRRGRSGRRRPSGQGRQAAAESRVAAGEGQGTARQLHRTEHPSAVSEEQLAGGAPGESVSRPRIPPAR